MRVARIHMFRGAFECKPERNKDRRWNKVAFSYSSRKEFKLISVLHLVLVLSFFFSEDVKSRQYSFSALRTQPRSYSYIVRSETELPVNFTE